MTTYDVFSRTDWAALAEQKLALLDAIDAPRKNTLALQGLLHWIDALQDAAANEGFPVVWLSEPDDAA